MSTHVVARTTDLPPGARTIIHIAGRSIGVFNVDGTYYALRNRCPHMGAPLCRGSITGTLAPSPPGQYHWHRDGQILRCPWHGWEFDITTGTSLFNPHTTKVKTYDVTVTPTPAGEQVETYDISVHDGLVLLHL